MQAAGARKTLPPSGYAHPAECPCRGPRRGCRVAPCRRRLVRHHVVLSSRGGRAPDPPRPSAAARRVGGTDACRPRRPSGRAPPQHSTPPPPPPASSGPRPALHLWRMQPTCPSQPQMRALFASPTPGRGRRRLGQIGRGHPALRRRHHHRRHRRRRDTARRPVPPPAPDPLAAARPRSSAGAGAAACRGAGRRRLLRAPTGRRPASWAPKAASEGALAAPSAPGGSTDLHRRVKKYLPTPFKYPDAGAGIW